MFYGELVYVILAPLTILGVIVLSILALAGRSEPDARGERAYVLYLSLVSYISFFTLLFALVALGTTVTHAVVDGGAECIDPYDPACFEGPQDFGGELRVRDAINGGAVAAVAGGILLYHRRRSQHLVDDPDFAGSAGARTFTAYLYAVAFTAMIVVLASAAVALPALIRAVAPGLTALDGSSGERDAALTDLVPALVAGGGAAAIYLTHWRAAEGLRGPREPRRTETASPGV